MRIVFLGTPAPAVPSLEAVLAAGHTVPLVVSQPDRPSGRSRVPVPPPVKVAAERRGIAVIQPEKIRGDAFLAALRDAVPDALVVVAYGRILPPAVLDLPPRGAVNVHFSLLPELRGAAPVQWALARALPRTGVSTMRVSEGLDEGDILLQREAPIAPGEHAPALTERLSALGAELLRETLRGLEAGSLAGTPQDPAAATYAPILRREDGAWSPAWTAADLDGRVRGFDPWPGVWVSCRGRRLRITDAAAMPGSTGAPPGTVLPLEGERLPLACARGTLAAIAAVQAEGGRPATAREAINGRRIGPGDRLGPPPPEGNRNG